MDDPVLQQLARSASQSGGSKGVGVLPGGVGYQDIGGRVLRYSVRKLEKVPGDEHRDVTLTRRWMDAMGTDVAVIFPSPMLQLGLHPQVEMEVAFARAYNRWLVERVLAASRASARCSICRSTIRPRRTAWCRNSPASPAWSASW